MEGINVDVKSGGYQATGKVVIKDFGELMTISKPGDCYPSARFMVGDVPMIVNVYPNGSKEHTGFVSIFLKNLGTDPIQVKCKFCSRVEVTCQSCGS